MTTNIHLSFWICAFLFLELIPMKRVGDYQHSSIFIYFRSLHTIFTEVKPVYIITNNEWRFLYILLLVDTNDYCFWVIFPHIYHSYWYEVICKFCSTSNQWLWEFFMCLFDSAFYLLPYPVPFVSFPSNIHIISEECILWEQR